jgi:hypothetical protein
LGYHVLRFSNADVMRNAEGVMETIMAALASPPLPGPLPDGEREQKTVARPAPSPLRGEGWGEGLRDLSHPKDSQ